MDRIEIERLTRERGGEWGIGHARRLLHLIGIIGEGLEYDEETVWLAAYLHDWGGWAPWAQPGVEHQVRSVQVVGEYLTEHDCEPDLRDAVLECIANHHGGSAGRRIESILITDADVLDLIGVVGTLRVFSMWPRDLRGAVEAARKWSQSGLAAISLDATREIAAERLAESDRLLEAFEAETFGMY